MDKSLVDIMWVIICAAEVCLMQGGFLCLEAGLTRTKNSINVAIKNLTDFGVSFLLFLLVGFGLMFGATDNGWIGTTNFFPAFNFSDPWFAAFFLYQAVFCGTAVTIVSGGVAERLKFVGYIVIAIIVSLIIYPVFGHWAWGGLYEGEKGWLAAKGFIDFAGSSVVHSVGGWVTLAILFIIGSRKGRFPEGEAPKKIPGCNLPLAMFGVLVLWVGWIGFNGGSTFAFNDQVPRIIMNTLTAATAGLVTTLCLGWFIKKYADPYLVINGSLAGLVSITACCYAVNPLQAIVIGGVGGVISFLTENLLEKLRIDDAIGAFPVHAAAGIWGTLAVAFFGDLEILGTGLTRWHQFLVQLQGVVVCAAWAFGVTFILLKMIDWIFPLRINEEEEQIGLNVSEHKATTEIYDLLTVLSDQKKSTDLSLRAPVEPFTEIGQIAQHYNAVMDSLQEALERTQTIVTSAKDSIITFFKDGLEITFFNPAAELAFGYKNDQVQGKTIMNLFSSIKEQGVDVNQFESIFEEEESNAFGVAKRSDGTTFPVELSISKGKTKKEIYTATIRDITQRVKDQEENFQKAQTVKMLQKVSQFSNQAKEGDKALEKILILLCSYMQWPIGHVYTLDNSTGDRMISTSIWWMPASKKFGRFKEVTEKLFFLKGEGLIGQVFKEKKAIWVKDITKDRFYKRHAIVQELGLKTAIAFPVSLGEEVTDVIEFYSTDDYREPDNELIEIIESAGKQLGTVRERERIMLRLKQEKELAEVLKKKAQDAAKTKSNFLANMSHEIRTPMNAILGFSDLLRRSDLNEKQKDYLNTVTAGGKLLIGIINDILDVSKLESGKFELELIDFDIMELTSDVFKMIVSRIEGKHIETYIDIAKDVPRSLKGDATRLKQVLVNLLGNAIKFTEKGFIGIIINLNNSQSTDNKVVLNFTVKDSGIGIPKDKCKLVFESFSQADDSTTRKYGGTGLGLTISKAIVEAMEGRIWVESEEGKGSEFKFTIKIAKGENVYHTENYIHAQKILKHKKVVIVDDSEIARKTLKKSCDAIGIEILLVADSAQAALQRIDQLSETNKCPDVILSDIMMAGIDGYAFVKKIRGHKALKDVKVIAVSADMEAGVKKHSGVSGFEMILSKPVTKYELADAMVKALGEKLNNNTKEADEFDGDGNCQGINILVVEDVLPNQELIKAYFQVLKCEADYADNGKEAVTMLKENLNKYDLCLMDMQMPIMGGEEATKLIRKEISKDLPIVALTAAAMKEDQEKCKNAGMNDYLAKPIDIIKLKKIILEYGHRKKGADKDNQKSNGAINILIVDDSVPNQQLLGAFLGQMGYKSDCANNGEEALNLIRADKDKYQVCLMDIQMPVMDGLEATKIIRKEISKSFPIIAVTGATEFDKETCLKVGMNGYMNKPVDMEKLKEIISEHIKASK